MTTTFDEYTPTAWSDSDGLLRRAERTLKHAAKSLSRGFSGGMILVSSTIILPANGVDSATSPHVESVADAEDRVPLDYWSSVASYIRDLGPRPVWADDDLPTLPDIDA